MSFNEEKNFQGISEYVKISPYTNYKIGGEARYFIEIKSKKDLIRALFFAKKCNAPFFILGGGSNLLFSDLGFNGLVIRMKNSGIKMENDGRIAKLTAQAGTKLAEVVDFAKNNLLGGMEWAIGIPGTVGGAIRGNAGAFAGSMKDCVKSVQALDAQSDNFKTAKFLNESCQFGYRTSFFRKNKSFIILSCEIELKTKNKKEIEKEMKNYLNKKTSTQPLEFPSAGSVFTNPNGLAAGKLIEDCGLKGKKIGGAQISEKHANFIINFGHATARDVKDLIAEAKSIVKRKFGVDLEEEIEIIESDIK